MARAPLFAVRFASYAMAFAWGAISLSIGLNTVVKQNRLKSFLRRSVAPLGITLRLVTNNVVHPAIASEVFCVIIALFSLAALAGLFVNRCSTKSALRAQGAIFAFLTIALFACQIPVSDAVRRKGVEIWGWQDGNEVPLEALLEAAASLGVNPIYKHIDFILWFGIIPWFAFLFALTSAIVSFTAVNKAEDTYTTTRARDSQTPMAQVA